MCRRNAHVHLNEVAALEPDALLPPERLSAEPFQSSSKLLGRFAPPEAILETLSPVGIPILGCTKVQKRPRGLSFCVSGQGPLDGPSGLYETLLLFPTERASETTTHEDDLERAGQTTKPPAFRAHWGFLAGKRSRTGAFVPFHPATPFQLSLGMDKGSDCQARKLCDAI